MTFSSFDAFSERRALLAGMACAAAALSLGLQGGPANAAVLGRDLPDSSPALSGTGDWFNSSPLTLSGLRGRVVLIDFWTYSCVNCLRTLPHVKQWHQRYASQGLVVIGVHTPEYAFERAPAGLGKAIERLGIRYPVVQDNAYQTWKAFNNRYWPAVYLIDRSGAVVFKHEGEGGYDEIEATLRRLLSADAQRLPAAKGR